MSDEMQKQPDHVERMHNELQAAIYRELLVAPFELSKGNIDPLRVPGWRRTALRCQHKQIKICARLYNVIHLHTPWTSTA